MNNLTWAQYYLKQGFSIIPIGKNMEGQHGLKAPLISSWLKYQTEKAPPEQVEKWWTELPESKIGIITGKISNLVVVDIDDPVKFKELGISLPSTVKVKTAKGLHFYYKYPSGQEIKNSKIFNKDIQVGDIKAEGGYVIAPPSEHHNQKDKIDGQYEWINPIGEMEMPEYVNLFDDFKSGKNKNQFDDIIKGQYKGNRNDGATVFLGTILKKLPQSQWATKAWPALIEWNKSNKPPMPDTELAVIFKSICGKELLNNGKKNNSETDKYRERFKPISSSELQKKTPEPFPYLLDGLIPEKAITVIAGNTGCGKSLFCLNIADMISQGRKIYNIFKTKQTKSLYIDLEMNEEDYIHRTKILCDDNNDNLLISYGTKWKLEEPAQLEVLEEFIRDNGIGLVVFDTLSKIHTGEENSNTEMTKVMDLLLDFIEKLKITIILIHHHNKGKDNEGIGKGRGASAIADNCASYLEVKSKTIKNDMGIDILAMDIEQHKRRRSSISKFGLNIQFYETDKALFEYREEFIREQDELDRVKPMIMNYVRNNPGLSQNKIKCHFFDTHKITKPTTTDALGILSRLNQLDEQIGKNRSKRYFIKTNIEQVKF